MKKDYYELLGINKNASESEIKKAFRKSAMKYHPDKMANASEEEKKASEEKFKEINAAFQVLSDPDKKRLYDQYGHAAFEQGGAGQGGFGGGFSGFSGFGEDFDFGDIFSSFFGGNSGFNPSSRSKRTNQGSNLLYKIDLTLEEIADGVEKTIEYSRDGKCNKCSGTGAKNGKVKTCTHCSGRGYVDTQQQTIFGMMRTQTECNHCHGTGSIPEDKCNHCHGSGISKEKISRTIHIPAGVEDGQRMVINDGGKFGGKGGEFGDLYVEFHEKEHKIFKRHGLDVYCKIPISFKTATLGGEIEIPTLRGKTKIKIDEGTQNGTRKRIRHIGIKGDYTKGNQILEIEVEVPVNLNSEQKVLLKKFYSSLDESNQKTTKGFWKTIKDMFTD